MAKSRKFLTAGAVGVAALALIGTGAGAAFNDSVSATQNISTGTLLMAISSTGTGGASDGVVSADGKSIVFTAGNAGSSFSQNHNVTVHNIGTLPLLMDGVTLSADGTNDISLAQATNLNLDGITFTVAAAQAQAFACTTAGVIGGPDCVINPGGSYTFAFDFSATDLTNENQGKSIGTKLTINGVDVPAGTPSIHNATPMVTHTGVFTPVN